MLFAISEGYRTLKFWDKAKLGLDKGVEKCYNSSEMTSQDCTPRKKRRWKTVKIYESVHREVRIEAAKRGITIAEFIQAAVRLLLTQES